MTPRARSVCALAAAAVLVGLGLGGCGDDDSEADATWAPVGAALDTGELTWADGTTVHVGETVIDTERPFDSYVVAGDSVWFVPKGAKDDELWRAGVDGAEPTDAHADPTELVASPDGRYLAFLDMVTGPKDQFDTPLAEAVVIDLKDGTELVRSSAGMGDTATDDLLDLYEDAALGVVAVSDDTAWIVTPGDFLAYDLPSGESSVVDDDEIYDPAHPWYTPRHSSGGPWNPAHTWAVDDTATQDLLVPDGDGEPVTPRAGGPTWSLFRWLDDDTAVGYSFDAPPTQAGRLDPDAERTLITCTVPEGACTPVPETTGVDPIRLPTPSLIPPPP